jgi:uncharacterized membrane protein YedE/YeeE
MIFEPLIGGTLIGVAVSLLLLFNGKVLGVSGIISELVTKPIDKNYWRLFFVLGLLVAPFIYSFYKPMPVTTITTNNLMVIVGGLLVGLGSRLGSGCTSGHGVCGIARLSIRSIIATITFISFGALTVFLIQRLFV